MTTTIINNAINAYGKFLQSGATYGEAMREAAQSLGGTPCPTLLEGLAKLHAKRYECNYTWDGKGSAVFFDGEESTRETRNDAARKSWQRNVMVWFTPEKPKAPTTHARLSKDARALAKAYLAEFATLSEAIAALRAVAK